MANIILEDVIARLESFGVTADDAALPFVVQLVEERIKNDCNISKIPGGLKHTAINMVCGEYLQQIASLGKAESLVANIDWGVAVKSIDVGDTKTTFTEAMTAEQKLAMLIAGLRNSDSLASYRRLRW